MSDTEYTGCTCIQIDAGTNIHLDGLSDGTDLVDLEQQGVDVFGNDGALDAHRVGAQGVVPNDLCMMARA